MTPVPPLAVTLGPSESQESWTELLEQLVGRGLTDVRLVIADGHAGLEAAVRRLLPEAKKQRHTVPLIRNMASKVHQRVRKRVACGVSAIFDASSRKEARARMEAFWGGFGA